MATSKTKTKKTTANSTAAKKTTATKKPKIKATPKPKSRAKKTKKVVQAAAVQTAVSAPVETSVQTRSEAVRFESRNPLDYFLRLDVLIALALFFLLVTTVISFTVMRQELSEAQQAIEQLEQIVYGR